jgi:hypothetical protein
MIVISFGMLDGTVEELRETQGRAGAAVASGIVRPVR